MIRQRTKASSTVRFLAGTAVLLFCVGQAIAAEPGTSGGTKDAVAARAGAILIDPCLGYRWQRVLDSRHPAGPARLIEIGAEIGPSTRPGTPVPARPAMVIHAGDRVIVEQQNSLVEARLDAVALTQAATGEMLRVRLCVGRNSEMSANGPVVEVLVIGAGLTRWLTIERSGR